MTEQKVGDVIHYWSKIGVAGIHVTDGELRVGDMIHIKGHTSDFSQRVGSMQAESTSVDVAGPGDDIGIKVADHAREHDQVFVVRKD